MAAVYLPRFEFWFWLKQILLFRLLICCYFWRTCTFQCLHLCIGTEPPLVLLVSIYCLCVACHHCSCSDNTRSTGLPQGWVNRIPYHLKRYHHLKAQQLLKASVLAFAWPLSYPTIKEERWHRRDWWKAQRSDDLSGGYGEKINRCFLIAYTSSTSKALLTQRWRRPVLPSQPLICPSFLSFAAPPWIL